MRAEKQCNNIYVWSARCIQPVRLAGSFRCWFVKKYCWLVCVREKYCSGWKFTIVYDKPQPNEQAVCFRTYASSVLYGCCICFTYKLQVFQRDVAYVL